MKDNVELKGRLGLYVQWPGIMIIFLAAMGVWVYLVDPKAGVVMSICVILYAVVVGIMYFYNRKLLLGDLVEFATQYGMLQNTLLKNLSAPYIILYEDGKMIWLNHQFQEIMDEEVKPGMYLSKFIPELNRSVFPKTGEERLSKKVTYNDRSYYVEMQRVSIEGLNNSELLMDVPEGNQHFITMYIQDVTDLEMALKETENQKLVAGLIYIDNYDEVMESIEEVRQSLLVALIDRKINQYVAAFNGIVKKLEKDKYFIAVKYVNYEKMEEAKFSLLEEVKNVSIGNKIPATLSVGVGLGADNYANCYNYARVAIDLALARGGDQAVVKKGNNIAYFGGKREQTSKNTRVKARVKAEALREFMMPRDRIIVMGHKMQDVDSFGAAIGIYRAAVTMDKKVNIVVNDITASLRPMYEAFKNDSSYPEGLFINSQEAESLVDDHTMVVVVDTNKPKMTECEAILKKTRTIVVLDHHRQSDEIIENAVLSYIEPYASSACEMVAEVLQYFSDDLTVTAMEANSLYAGIIIDTNNFMTRTGVRTFEAAAYLRRCGADITYVRKLLRDDLSAYRAKASIISSAQVYKERYAIAKGKNLGIESPTVVGAQAANELLNIDGIKASFVLTEYNGRIYISARSIDEVNVQIIMERLGGGGHMTIAGAQFAHTDMEQAIETLCKTIDVMTEEGDI